MPVQVKIDFGPVRAQLERLGRLVASPRALMVALKEWLLRVSKDSFEKQASPEGEAWKPLSPKYALRKARLRPGRNILYASGFLRASLVSGSTDTTAWVESRLPYAAVHQYGGRAGRRQAALIPARPYLPGAPFAELEGQRITEEFLQDAIDGAAA